MTDADADGAVALYDTMCRAIDAAYEIDEVKDIRDKALAFEAYARQARNTEAERRACEIRLRAERKAGRLDREREKAKGGQPYQRSTGSTAEPVDRPPTLADLGVTKRQMHDWRKLADVPEDEFEAALVDQIHKPSTRGIITASGWVQTVPVATGALWLWGRLKDFDRDGLLAEDPPAILLTMTPAMLDDVHRLAPRVAAWLGAIGRLQSDD